MGQARQRQARTDRERPLEGGWSMFEEYKETTDLIVSTFNNTRWVDDLAGDDFEKLLAGMA